MALGFSLASYSVMRGSTMHGNTIVCTIQPALLALLMRLIGFGNSNESQKSYLWLNALPWYNLSAGTSGCLT